MQQYVNVRLITDFSLIIWQTRVLQTRAREIQLSSQTTVVKNCCELRIASQFLNSLYETENCEVASQLSTVETQQLRSQQFYEIGP